VSGKGRQNQINKKEEEDKMRRPRILIVDDDLVAIKFLRSNLEARGCQTFAAMDGTEALNIVERELPDLVILDIMLPRMDGIEVCRRLREWSQIPIIILSARSDVSTKVQCLDLGADDYITKPFGINELIARIRAVFRRTKAAGATPIRPSFTNGDLEINFAQRRVTVGSKEVKLTPTEYSLLQEFALNAGKVLTHSYLLNRVWGPEYSQEKEYVRVLTGRLRAKLGANSVNCKYITAVRGVGYQFEATPQ